MATRYLDYHGLQTFKGELDDIFDTKLNVSQKGANNGLAELDSSGKVPSSQLPSYVDDVVEYASRSNFPETGESGKIYIAIDTLKTYRWGGSTYSEISESLALGETSTTAYRGDHGKAAYDHASAKGNAFASGLYKITTNSEGHVTAATAVQKSDITGLGVGTVTGITMNNSAVTIDANGSADLGTVITDISGKVDKETGKGLSSNDYTDNEKLKLAGIAAGATANVGTVTGITMNGSAKTVAADGTVDLGTVITAHQDISGKIDATEKGANGGVATLGQDGKVPASQLPAGQTTISKIMMNGSEAPMDSSGIVNLGTVITAHQDISGKIDSPSTPGTSGQVLTSDGQGGQSWQTPSGGGGTVTDVQEDGTSILSSGIANILTMTGAGSSAAGTKGLVPAPAAGDNGKFLKGNGTWDNVPDPQTMTGATSSTAGAGGLVPAPAAGDNDKFLRGDGTWTVGGTLRKIPFSIIASDWVFTNGEYVATVPGASGIVSATSYELINLDKTFRDAIRGDFSHRKNSGNNGYELVTDIQPVATLTGEIASIANDDGKVAIVTQETALPTIRDIPFSIQVSDWALSSGVYVATFDTAFVTTTSHDFVDFDISIENASDAIIPTKKTGGGGMTFTTRRIPTGTISGTITPLDNADGKVAVALQGTVMPISGGGTGETTLAGTKSAFGITALESSVATLSDHLAQLLKESDLGTYAVKVQFGSNKQGPSSTATYRTPIPFLVRDGDYAVTINSVTVNGYTTIDKSLVVAAFESGAWSFATASDYVAGRMVTINITVEEATT